MSVQDVFAVAPAYEAYMGRWSRPVADVFLRWLGVPPGRRWLDVGCGTGALTETIVRRANPAEVVGVDRSGGFIRHARGLGLGPTVSFLEGDAQALPVDSGRFDAVVSGLVLNFVPDRPRMVAEMVRAAAPDGTVAVFVWDQGGGMELISRFWEVVTQVDRSAAARDESLRFRDVCAPGPLEALFAGAGLKDVSSTALEVPTVFVDFEDYWRPFLGGQGPTSAYLCSLPADRQAEVREGLRAALPAAADGSIRLRARAWAARGKKPGAAREA